MATSHELIKELENATKGMKQLAKIALNKVALDLVADFQENSPVDKGGFKKNWDFANVNVIGSLAAVSIFNSAEYAVPLEEGSPVGGKPWKSAGEKTAEHDGRIWSKQAIGGITTPVFEDDVFIDDLAKTINMFIFGGL